MIRIFTSIFTLFCCITPANAQVTWVNPSGGNFLTASNWSGGLTPSLLDDVLIDLAGTYAVTIDDNAIINSLTLNNTDLTVNQSNGAFVVNGLYTQQAGSYNLSGGSLTIGGGMNFNGGSFTISNGAVVNLTGVLSLNSGSFIFNRGTINGGSIISNGAKIKLGGQETRLNNVSIGAGALDTSTSFNLTLSGGSQFATGSSYQILESSSLNIGANQTGISGVSLNFVGNGISYIRGFTENSTWTIGSSGTSNPAISVSLNETSAFSLTSQSPNNSIVNSHIIEINGAPSAGSLDFTPTGTFTNSAGAIVRNNGGQVFIWPQGGFINHGTVYIAGTVNLNGGPIANFGEINLQNSGELRIFRPFSPQDLGVVNRSSPTAGVLTIWGTTMTMNSDFDIAGLGSINVRSNTAILGNPSGHYKLTSSNASKLHVPDGLIGYLTVSNLEIGKDSIDLSQMFGRLELTNQTTFESGSRYYVAPRTGILFGNNQSGISNIIFDIDYDFNLYGNISNSTITIGSARVNCEDPADTIINISGTNGEVISGLIFQQNSVPNVSFVNNADINVGKHKRLVVNIEGNFTNNGHIVLGVGSEFLVQNPSGNGTSSFINGPCSKVVNEFEGYCTFHFPLFGMIGSELSSSSGQIHINSAGMGRVEIDFDSQVSLTGTAILNVGNTSNSEVKNQGSFSLGLPGVTGGTLNVGSNSNPGMFSQIGGNLIVNGTVNSRLDVSGGVLTGAGTINALNTRSIVVSPGGTLSPGNSPGKITIGGGFDLAGTLKYEIAQNGTNNANGAGDAGTPGVGFDTITVRPPVNNSTAQTDAIIRQNSQIQVVTANTQSSFQSDVFWQSNRQWTLLNTTNGSVIFKDGADNPIGVSVPNVVLQDLSGQTIDYSQTFPNGSFTFELTNLGNEGFGQNQLNLVWSPVPEANSILAFCFVSFGVASLISHKVKAGR